MRRPATRADCCRSRGHDAALPRTRNNFVTFLRLPVIFFVRTIALYNNRSRYFLCRYRGIIYNYGHGSRATPHFRSGQRQWSGSIDGASDETDTA